MAATEGRLTWHGEAGRPPEGWSRYCSLQSYRNGGGSLYSRAPPPPLDSYSVDCCLLPPCMIFVLESGHCPWCCLSSLLELLAWDEAATAVFLQEMLRIKQTGTKSQKEKISEEMLAVWPLDDPRSLFWGVEPVSVPFVSVISGKEVYFDSII